MSIYLYFLRLSFAKLLFSEVIFKDKPYSLLIDLNKISKRPSIYGRSKFIFDVFINSLFVLYFSKLDNINSVTFNLSSSEVALLI